VAPGGERAGVSGVSWGDDTPSGTPRGPRSRERRVDLIADGSRGMVIEVPHRGRIATTPVHEGRLRSDLQTRTPFREDRFEGRRVPEA
jgi:hypothetical protein